MLQVQFQSSQIAHVVAESLPIFPPDPHGTCAALESRDEPVPSYNSPLFMIVRQAAEVGYPTSCGCVDLVLPKLSCSRPEGLLARPSHIAN